MKWNKTLVTISVIYGRPGGSVKRSGVKGEAETLY